MYSFDSRIRYSEVDSEGMLSIPSLINYLQDCSTFQSESLGGGVEALKKKGLLWVINFWQVDIIKLPKLCDNVKICTAPYEFKSFLGCRNFWMLDDKGEFLVKANSIWSLLNAQTGKPCVATDDVIGIYAIEDKLDMEYAPRKIAVPDDCAEVGAITIEKQHLDTNHHVNNGQYVQLASYYLKAGANVKGVRAEYRRQTLLGDVLTVKTYADDTRQVVSLLGEDGKPNVNVEFVFG